MKIKRHFGRFLGEEARNLKDKTADEIVAAAKADGSSIQEINGNFEAEVSEDLVTLTSDGRHAVRVITLEGNEIFPEEEVAIDIYETTRQRSRFTDAEKLAIIAEHLCGDTLDAVQRRHGLGHSTLKTWMTAFGITPRDGDEARRIAALEKENERLRNKIAQQESTIGRLRGETGRLLGKIRAARTALVLADGLPDDVFDPENGEPFLAKEDEAA